MEFTNSSLEKVNEAQKLVTEFTTEVLKRAKIWLEANFTGNYELPDPHIIFEQEGWIIEIIDLDRVLNATDGAPIQFRFYHSLIQPIRLSFSVPEDAIFGSEG